MGVPELIAADLGARATAGVRGMLLTFERDGHWHTLTVRESPHLELTLPAPGLVGLELRLQLGEPTLRGDRDGEHVIDPRWRMRTNNLDRATLLLDEPPWPHGDAHPPRRLGQYADDFTTPRYVLTVEEGVATLERRSSENALDLAIGMARRLVQLVTRPARREAEIARASLRDQKRNGPYR